MSEKSVSSKISRKEMRDAIRRSGYLLEQQVEPILREQGYYVETNAAFLDCETGKSREIDIFAITAVPVYTGDSFIFPVLLCECENNEQPVVFFSKEPLVGFLYREDVKFSGMPVKLWTGKKYVKLSEFLGLEKFHHYCKNAVATQYCTFHRPKDRSSWLALHPEEQHRTFDSLIKAMEHQINEHYKSWVMPDKADEEPVNIQIYYPLVILAGDLYCAQVKGNSLDLRKAKHAQYRKELFLPRSNRAEAYQIDVITQRYLPEYLRMVDFEVSRIKRVLQRKEKTVLYSVRKIIEEAKVRQQQSPQPPSFRELFEMV